MNEPVDNEAYFALFQTNRVGRLIFEEMCGVFYDIDAFDMHNTHNTAFMAGQRAVMKHIIIRLQSAEGGVESVIKQPEGSAISALDDIG